MSADQRLDRLYPGLSAEERALLVPVCTHEVRRLVRDEYRPGVLSSGLRERIEVAVFVALIK